MAYIGLRKPIIGKWTADGTYSAPVACGKAIAMTVTPNYSETSLFADDGQDEYDKEFSNADVKLGTNTIPLDVAATLFGHTIDTTKKGVTYNKDDTPSYVGIGIIQPQTVSGTRSFQAMFIYKAKFSDPEDSFETKGDTITYKTPEISGKAIPDGTGKWKDTMEFETEALALTWINTTMFGQTA